MNRILTWGKWLLIGTLIFHVLNANYVINRYAARVESMEIAIKRMEIEVSRRSMTVPMGAIAPLFRHDPSLIRDVGSELGGAGGGTSAVGLRHDVVD